MSIVANGSANVVIQGLTGGYARPQARAMLDFGTPIVAGVTPGKGGSQVFGLPVYDSMAEAALIHGVDSSVVYAPPRQALDAVWETLDIGVHLVVVAAEGVPVKDAVLMRRLADQYDARLIGPNTIGLISPAEILLGSFPEEYALAGSIGVVARSGSLAIEVMRALSAAGLGQSTVVAVGGDPVIGSQLFEFFREFENDEETDLVVYLGEVGGLKEHALATNLSDYTKPVIAYIAGACAPPNTRMGHVGAIVYGQRDSADAKTESLRAAGALIASTPWEIVDIAASLLSSSRKDIREE